jgi:Sulfotransferase family
LLDQLPPYRRHVNHVFDRTIAIARAALDVSGKDVFVDASKPVARVPYLHRRSELDFRILHIVRDVRAIVRSRTRGHDSTGRAARSWVRTHANALRLASRVGEDRYFRFRWEDFCLHPEEGLDRICHFLDVEPADLIGRVNAQQHHVIGNQMRLKPVGTIRSDQSWREVMTPQQLAICERIAGPLNRQFGYS